MRWMMDCSEEKAGVNSRVPANSTSRSIASQITPSGAMDNSQIIAESDSTSWISDLRRENVFRAGGSIIRVLLIWTKQKQNNSFFKKKSPIWL